MGAITIRDLSDNAVRQWAEHAGRRGSSVEAELRRVIEAGPEAVELHNDQEDTGPHDPEALAALDVERQSLLGPDGKLRPGPELIDYMRRWRHAMFGDRVFPDSVPLIRKMRYEDDPAAWDGV